MKDLEAKPTAIGRRIEKSLFYLKTQDIESCLVNLFPAIDKSAKKRYPKIGVGARIKNFVANEEGIISILGTNNLIKGVVINGVTFPEAVYKFGRTSIVHEGELDKKLSFLPGGNVRIGDSWELNHGYLMGMIAAVVFSPENANERSPVDYFVEIQKKQWNLNRMWGERAAFVKQVRVDWKMPDLEV